MWRVSVGAYILTFTPIQTAVSITQDFFLIDYNAIAAVSLFSTKKK